MHNSSQPHRQGPKPGLIRLWPIAFTLLPAVAQAHPGHSLPEASLSHVLTSPDHLAMLAALGALSWATAYLVTRRGTRRLLQAVGVLGVTSALLLWKFAA